MRRILISGLIFCALSSINLFASEEVQHANPAHELAKEHSPKEEKWGFINANAQHKDDIKRICKEKVQHKECKTTLLFKAETCECRIGIDDQSLIERGQADFVTAFEGNDFECSVIDVKFKHHHHKHPTYHKALKILPKNGYSFTYGSPQNTNPNPPPPFVNVDGPAIGGFFDHVKFSAYSVNTTAPVHHAELCTKWVASAAQLNVDETPFSSSVKNPREDCRLASVGLTTFDPELLLENSWICTDEIIYVLVGRIPQPGTDYAAYSYLIPIFKRKPCNNPKTDVHTFEICYNRSRGTMKWVLDGHKVFMLKEFGVRLTSCNAFIYDHQGKKVPLENPTRLKVLEHGGVDTPVHPINLQSGIGFFTFFDAYRPNNLKGTESRHNRGLVRLESSEFRKHGHFYYNNPLKCDHTIAGPASFVKDSCLDLENFQYSSTIPWQFRLFGQGAQLVLFDYEVFIKN